MNFFRFPTWLSCPRCNVLKQHGLELVNSPRCSSHHRLLEGSGVRCSELPQRARKIMKPVRFLIACEDGHIDDFPWSRWVHRGSACTASEEVLFITSTSFDGLAGVKVSCVCGAQRTMNRAFNPDVLLEHLPDKKCTGRRPWLGSDVGNEDCSCRNVRTVQRGSSGIYFPNIMSSILIPPYSGE